MSIPNQWKRIIQIRLFACILVAVSKASVTFMKSIWKTKTKSITWSCGGWKWSQTSHATGECQHKFQLCATSPLLICICFIYLTRNPSIEGDTPFKSCKSSSEIYGQEISNKPKSYPIADIRKLYHLDTWNKIEAIYRRLKIPLNLQAWNRLQKKYICGFDSSRHLFNKTIFHQGNGGFLFKQHLDFFCTSTEYRLDEKKKKHLQQKKHNSSISVCTSHEAVYFALERTMKMLKMVCVIGWLFFFS